ncbi:MAG: hypothetical protein P9X24_15350 [Candidatus Hatepunaea meridiana]|nr:hypothetical protein [Candidatus Hatepunaea meridiana]
MESNDIIYQSIILGILGSLVVSAIIIAITTLVAISVYRKQKMWDSKYEAILEILNDLYILFEADERAYKIYEHGKSIDNFNLYFEKVDDSHKRIKERIRIKN